MRALQNRKIVGCILYRLCEHKFEGNGSFSSFMRMKWMDKIPFKMDVILAWAFNMGAFCLHFPFSMSHIFNSRTGHHFNRCNLAQLRWEMLLSPSVD